MDKEALLSKILRASLADLGLELDFQLEQPVDEKFGDLATNVAMTSFKLVQERFASPQLFANALVERIKVHNQNQLLEKVEVLKPGFINFTFKIDYFLQNLQKICQDKDVILQDLGQRSKAIVEYSSPNIAKPFTIGHLRSTFIGDAIANLLEASNYQVFRDNHLGDWGTQFGKQIVAIKHWGDEQEISQAVNPVKKLVELYVKFHAEAEKDPSLEDEARLWFKKLEDGDPEARDLWQKCIDWSFKEFAKIYATLGVTFTENNGRGYGESFFEQMLPNIISELKTKGLAEVGKEGALLIFYPNNEFSPLMILKKDGSTLYATRDLATDKWRRNNPRYQNTDGSAPLVVNEVGSEQSFYFQQLYRAEELLGWYKLGQRVHVKHGLYRFSEGKMSTRKGNVIWLEEVLKKAKEQALTFTSDENIAEAVSIAALKWNDLKRKSELNINFDWQEILNLQGNSGPYMLYTYARAQSVLNKAQTLNIKTKPNKQTTMLQLTAIEKSLLKKITEFDKVVARSAREYAAHYLCTYLFDLAQLFNSFYNQCPILSSSLERQFRLQLVAAVSIILKKGLNLLGIRTLQKM